MEGRTEEGEKGMGEKHANDKHDKSYILITAHLILCQLLLQKPQTFLQVLILLPQVDILILKLVLLS